MTNYIKENLESLGLNDIKAILRTELEKINTKDELTRVLYFLLLRYRDFLKAQLMAKKLDQLLVNQVSTFIDSVTTLQAEFADTELAEIHYQRQQTIIALVFNLRSLRLSLLESHEDITDIIDAALTKYAES